MSGAAMAGFGQWLRLRARRWLVSPVCRRIYRDGIRDTRRSAMIAGAGRSGTTWVADLVQAAGACRVMFEPFHSRLVPEFGRFQYFQYLRPDEDNEALRQYCQQVFSGELRNPWVDRMVECLRPEFRLIKEIRANLFLRWLHLRFPEVPLLFVIRHPCAVVLSRMQLDWATDGDLEPFLRQPALIEDFLGAQMELIGRSTTPEEKHAIVWCISNLVPLRQFPAGELPIVRYERLITDPEAELPRVFAALRRDYDPAVLGALRRPSHTSRGRAARRPGRSQAFRWQQELSTGQIDRILAIVHAFGLHELGDEPVPR